VVSALVAAVPTSQLEQAYAWCARLARGHYENFPVASRLLPARMRPAVSAIYAFARTADDFADEPGMEDTRRFERLDDWHARLRRASLGPPAVSDEHDLVFLALSDSIVRHRLPLDLFEDLLSAFRQDVTTRRYRTWDDLFDYCRRSANPVGRLVLRVAGYHDSALDRASDAVCTALQLTNFWQDLERDWTVGRIYVPLEERDRAGARDADLDTRTMTSEWRDALEGAATRTRALFEAGRPVCDAVRGRLRWELRLTWLGGMRILTRLERSGFDVFHHRPSLTLADAPALVAQAITWR
jgi:hydroxysqualene synthase